jgi:hypothetical protein
MRKLIIALTLALAFIPTAHAQGAPGICPSLSHSDVIKIENVYRHRYPKVIAYTLITPWDKNAYLVIIYWDGGKQHDVQIKEKNNCTLKNNPYLHGHSGINPNEPYWWPAGIPFP